MFNIKEDNDFHEIREKSVKQWLSYMEGHEDIEVRGGVRATEGYIEGLKDRIQALEQKSLVQDKYLKQMSEKLRKL